MSYQQLEKSLRDKCPITAEELDYVKGYFSVITLNKKQIFSPAGNVTRYLAFLEKGGMISYSIDDKGSMRIVQFAFEGGWIADLYSYFTSEPSLLTIEAVEKSDVLVIKAEDYEKLIVEIPAFETYVRKLYQNAYVALQRRVEETVGLSGEEKYLRLVDGKSPILSRVPLHLIASYLGISPESLSRIRKNIVR